MQSRPTEVIRADLNDPDHTQAILDLLDAYALDPMGSGNALPETVRQRLIDGLREHPTTLVFLARSEQGFVGMATCFTGYSTFNARPLINIHDLAVLPAFRGLGIGRALLRHIAQAGQAAGCCKLTLEVREDNQNARKLYQSEGFCTAQINDRQIQYLFLERPLTSADSYPE